MIETLLSSPYFIWPISIILAAFLSVWLSLSTSLATSSLHALLASGQTYSPSALVLRFGNATSAAQKSAFQRFRSAVMSLYPSLTPRA